MRPRTWSTAPSEPRRPTSCGSPASRSSGCRAARCTCPILGCFDGGLPAWSIGTSPNAELANSSLEAACGTFREGQRPVTHSDRGCHYRWPGWIAICEKNHLTRSMSKKGCSPDNSAMEGFFGGLKNEFFHHRDWSGVTVPEFCRMLDAYLRYFNEERPKEKLGWLSPMQHRRSLGLAT